MVWDIIKCNYWLNIEYANVCKFMIMNKNEMGKLITQKTVFIRENMKLVLK